MKALLAWYRRHKRDLPWRHTRDAYRIFISEIMLQQTQVDRVIPKYQAWLKRFPTWKDLAQATTADLLHAWAGLGYNRRALQTREAARFVVAHGEPKREEDWKKLKGVGPYTAAALTEFANHKRAIVIDTNVRRVAGRLFVGECYPQLDLDARLLPILDRQTPRRGAHWDLPQAFMDLGSAICTSREPKCVACPLRKTCKAAPKFLSGQHLSLSRGQKVKEKRHVNKTYPDRIYRGRILAWARQHTTTSIEKLGPSIDETYDEARDLEWVRRMCERLIKDGLLELTGNDHIGLSCL